MAKKGKQYNAAFEKLDRDKLYAPREALELAKSLAFAKFDETVEVHLRLGVDPRHSDQQIRDTVILPHGLGKEVRVLVFAEGDAARDATAAGADFVGSDDMVEKIESGWADFDVAIAVPEMMGKVGKLGRFLGPRGLMPAPKAGTVVPGGDITRAVEESKAGKVEFRNDKSGNMHVPIGKVSFEVDQLEGNMLALMESVTRSRPAAVKGAFVRRLVVTTTMGPGIRVDPSNVAN